MRFAAYNAHNRRHVLPMVKSSPEPQNNICAVAFYVRFISLVEVKSEKVTMTLYWYISLLQVLRGRPWYYTFVALSLVQENIREHH
jgi:hypothetical protein